jgi:hypothetical protein
MATCFRGMGSIAAVLAFLGPGVIGEWSIGVKATVQDQARTNTAAPDVAKLGPQVGEKVADFSLPDQHGRTHSLASLMRPKGLVLVFNRSADW